MMFGELRYFEVTQRERGFEQEEDLGCFGNEAFVWETSAKRGGVRRVSYGSGWGGTGKGRRDSLGVWLCWWLGAGCGTFGLDLRFGRLRSRNS